MTALPVISMSPAEVGCLPPPRTDAGLGALSTRLGNLPLDRLDVRARISGLVARTTVTTEFVNAFAEPLEATYIFPLPDRAAVTGMTMTADGRTVEADLQERGAAREAYDAAISAGQRASIAEEDRPDVFTMRVGNIVPGERVTVTLSLTGPLPWEDDAATYRFPLVVAPRYIPGSPLPGAQAGDGQIQDTDATPDASRITPPVLLPGFPSPVRLSIGVSVESAGLSLSEARSSLHTVTRDDGLISIAPGERADRDFVLRLPYAGSGSSAVFVPDASSAEGTYQVIVLPPSSSAAAPRPKDVVLLLDRSGSMHGWKMVAARRAAARVVDTLTAADRFAVCTFDDRVEWPADLGEGLADATDRNRYRAVEHLARVDSRGGTELLGPLQAGLALLSPSDTPRDRVLVLITDGQVGNEDQILHRTGATAAGVRIHTVGIDRAVNAGFLGRLAATGGGRCELVESEDRLDEAMDAIHRRIAAPLVIGVTVDGLGQRRPESIFPGVPLVIFGRSSGAVPSSLTVRGRTRDDAEFRVDVPVRHSDEPAVTAQWARARLRELEDRYTIGEVGLEREIVETSLRHRVLCRFTAWLAIDSRVVAEGGQKRRVTQPVESPSGWEPPAAPQGFQARRAAAPVHYSLGADAAARRPGRAAAGGGGARGFGGGAPAGPPAYHAAPESSGFSAGPEAPAYGAPREAPIRGAAPDDSGYDAPMSAPLAAGPPPPAPGGSGSRPLMRSMAFAGLPRDGQGTPGADLVEFARTEAARLQQGAHLSAPERRDLLDDLGTRLHAILTGVPEPEAAALFALKRRLLSGIADLPTLWSEALHLLQSFADDTAAPDLEPDPALKPDTELRADPEPQRRKPFWK